MLTGSEANDCSSIIVWVFSIFLLIQSVIEESIVHFFFYNCVDYLYQDKHVSLSNR